MPFRERGGSASSMVLAAPEAPVACRLCAFRLRHAGGHAAAEAIAASFRRLLFFRRFRLMPTA